MPIKDVHERRAYQLAWLAKRRAAWFKGKVCETCGSEDNLELDHVDRSTKIDHRVWSWSQSRRDEELAKCVPRCHKCHSKRSGEQAREYLSRPIVHGTVSAYLRKKCKCEICLDFYKKWRRNKYERIGT